MRRVVKILTWILGVVLVLALATIGVARVIAPELVESHEWRWRHLEKAA